MIMHSCKQIQEIFERYLAGELLPSDQEKLDQHLPSCPDCQALMSIHEELMRMDDDSVDPSPEALQAMRSRVLGQISRQNKHGNARHDSRRIPSFVPALAAAAMLVLGIFLGSWFTQPPSVDDQLLEAITRQATIERSLENSWDAPLFFSNVSVRNWDGKRVSLGFDICRSADLSTGLNSPLAGDILTQAILNSESVGGRMRAMEIAAKSTDQRLTSALIVALQQDPDQTMRISALNALAGKDNSNQVQMALLSALRDDDSVQVRILALEHLVGESLGAELIETSIREGNEATNAAVLQRARELKTNMSAEAWL
jgi:predicted anti-sigma-YlaC factor YlaD